ncbi:MAG: phosphotransferase [Kiritimatiellae bacterium]|nr:phosphotransferase [Kiritimatiellia bacterium]
MGNECTSQSSAGAELHLLVLWASARFAEKKILAAVSGEVEIVCTREIRFPCEAEEGYRRFYGPSLPNSRHKVVKCGRGPFLLVVVRDHSPEFGPCVIGLMRYEKANLKMLRLKMRCREMAGRHHRVHGTVTCDEFARDVEMLTGHTAAEWNEGVPRGELAMRLPDTWTAVTPQGPFLAAHIAPGGALEVAQRALFLENKYINDSFETGVFLGAPCIVKRSSKAVWSVGNEYRMAARMYAANPATVPRPLAWAYHYAAHSAEVVTARVAGPSLADLLKKGVADAQANGFAADVRSLAETLKKEGIIHRDLFEDNLLLDADGHLKAIDWQLAIDRHSYREDPWVERHWKFLYVVFGVNRELGMGNWNDFHALGKVLARLPQTAAVRETEAWLAAEAPAMGFSKPPRGLTALRLRLYAVSLRFQILLNLRRPEKRARLVRRLRTILAPPRGGRRKEAQDEF